jgi:hypothetical protein
VTGTSYGSATADDYATVKYDAFGDQLWVARYDGPGNNDDDARSIALDESGNVYVTGHSWASGSYDDYTTIKYDASGNPLWVARYIGPGTDEANCLSLDSSGNVYVTGYSWAMGTYDDYATIKYNSVGVEQWVARYSGPGSGYDNARSIAIDTSGNIYVTGYSQGGGPDYDYATVKYNATGNLLWVARYNGPQSGTDCAYSFALDGGGHVFITGYSYGSGTDTDFATIKYSGGNPSVAGLDWLPLEATVFGQPLPQEYRLEQNYPNPFNASTVLSYQLPVASHVSLKVYDPAGRLVESLVDGWRSAGTHELTFDASDLPSGMYIYRLSAGDFSASSKMVLLK